MLTSHSLTGHESLSHCSRVIHSLLTSHSLTAHCSRVAHESVTQCSRVAHSMLTSRSLNAYESLTAHESVLTARECSAMVCYSRVCTSNSHGHAMNPFIFKSNRPTMKYRTYIPSKLEMDYSTVISNKNIYYTFIYCSTVKG